MAYQVRERDPIFDEATQVMIERRGKELLGITLLALAIMLGLIVGTYAPDDPGWMSATEGPANNAFGRFGATLASPLVIILGRAAWGFPLAIAIWGARFLFHQGGERMFSRGVFTPIAVAFYAVYASSLVPPTGWSHSFGLGGLFGDTILGAVLAIWPGGAAVALKIMAAIAGIGGVLTAAFALGVDRGELNRMIRFLVVGVVMTYVGLLRLTRMGARRAAAASWAQTKATVRNVIGRVTQMREERRSGFRSEYNHAAFHDEPPVEDAAPEYQPPEVPLPPAGRVVRAEPRLAAEAPRSQPALSRATTPAVATPHMEPAQAPAPATAPLGGLLARVPGLMRRAADPQPELIDNTFHGDLPDTAENPDRISAKIASALRNRSRSADDIAVVEDDLPTTTSQMIARAAAKAKAQRTEPALRAEPPVSAVELPPVHRRAQTPPATPDSTIEPDEANIFVDTSLPTERAAPLSLEPDMRAYAPDELTDEPTVTDPWMPGAEAVWEPDYGVEDLPTRQPDPVPAAPVQPAKKAVVQHAQRKPVKPSTRAMAEAQPSLAFADPEEVYELPPLSLLTNPVNIERHHLSDEALEENARMLESVLDDYGVKGEIVSVRPGPVVTMYELEPAPGLKASRVIGLADDIARSMSALSARVSTVPGRSVIGIELPNANREKVVLREILAARDFGDTNQKLPLALGKDIGGDPIVANLSKMPHLLIAGTTGSGKSVAINTMILSLLYRLTPEECRLIMIDPKMLELSVYDGIPHLLSPVVTDPKKAVVALKWVVGEMEERYRKMSKMGVRNIDGYNSRVADAQGKGEMFSRTVQTGFDEDTGEPIFETEEFQPEKLPYIVVIVDEMADLMMVAGKEIEACIQRLAQMARASGIHLIMATQRPSVDVITGTIKANFPTRISFQVTSKVDSRTILGEQGAEQLLGMGDMLYMAGGAKITRVHGPFVSDEEVEEIVTYLKSFGPPEYVGGVIEGPDDGKADDIDAVLGLNTGGNTGGEDALYDQAVAIVIKDRKCSTSYIQRKLGIGYNKAARLVEQMEDEGLVSAANHVGKREILIPEQ